MNDPNGMVYYKGIYHLFFQYYPHGTVWGPMHWGHAESRDLVHWRQEPIALYPDSLGYIFSGSVVLDRQNTSGLGKRGVAPLVAIFTQHDTSRARALTHTFQNESIAYSLDNGTTWIKYTGNPVLKNPGIADFRDPKVMWYPQGKEWIMTLATGDRVTFYSSYNLKDWKKESDFGSDAGAHGGVWECPDLFALDNGAGKKIWVLLVSINPGGPNGGSATQYFTGFFDGHRFRADNAAGVAADRKGHEPQVRWVDYGPDDYAGVTWSNSGSRRIFLGWMSNWNYAGAVPTGGWRSANTLPRQLGIRKVDGSWRLVSRPVKEVDSLIGQTVTLSGPGDSVVHFAGAGSPGKVIVRTTALASFALQFTNDIGETATVGYDKTKNRYYIDRRHSGKVDFAKDFGGEYYAERLGAGDSLSLSVYIDACSLEIFADGG